MTDTLSDPRSHTSMRRFEEIACHLGLQSYTEFSALADCGVDAVFTEALRAFLLRNSDRVSLLRHRATEICIALEDVGLPALVTLYIIDAALPNNVQMAAKWALATTVKHFAVCTCRCARGFSNNPDCAYQQLKFKL